MPAAARWTNRHAKFTSDCALCHKVIWACNCASCKPGAPRSRPASEYRYWQEIGAVHPRCWGRLFRAHQAKLEIEAIETAAGRPPVKMPTVAPPVERGRSVTYVKGEDGSMIRLEDVQRQEREASQE